MQHICCRLGCEFSVERREREDNFLCTDPARLLRRRSFLGVQSQRRCSGKSGAASRDDEGDDDQSAANSSHSKLVASIGNIAAAATSSLLGPNAQWTKIGLKSLSKLGELCLEFDAFLGFFKLLKNFLDLWNSFYKPYFHNCKPLSNISRIQI